MAKTREKFDVEYFASSFKKKQFAPVYFFYGEETFYIDETVDALIANAVDPSMKEFNLDILHGNDVEGKRIVAIASSYPMMADRRVVIIKDFDRVSDKDPVESYAEHPSPTTTLVLIARAADFRKKPYSTFKKLGLAVEAAPLRDYETIVWIESKMKRLKRTIEPAAMQLLATSVGTSLRELTNEIEKLLLTTGERSAITVGDVERVVGVSREFSPFELANAVAEKNIARSIAIADRLIGSGDSAVGMVAVLTQHFVKLWKLKDGIQQKKPDGELAQIVSAHPYYLKSYLAQAHQYRSADIEHAFLLLAEADLALKSSGDQKLILTTVIAEIISGIGTRREPATA